LSPLWDLFNLDTTDKARTTQAKCSATKIIRDNLLERSITKNNLKCLQQISTTHVKPTYVNHDQERPTKAWIDLIIVGSRANHIWQTVDISSDAEREHRTITALCTNKQQSGNDSLCQRVRYKPGRISKDDLIELRLRVSKMRNNWQKQTWSVQIERLEMITNQTMLAIKTLQETKAKVILQNRHK